MGNKKNKLNMNLKKIKRAIISVADKSNVPVNCKTLLLSSDCSEYKIFEPFL